MKKMFFRLVILLISLLAIMPARAADVWINPGPFPEGMDTWFGNYYNTTAQHVSRDRVGGYGDAYYSLLRFDLSGLPQVASRVLLWIRTIPDDGTPMPINWYKINEQWQSDTVGYNNFPWGTLLPLWWTPPLSPGYWYAIDITDIYNKWRTGTVGDQNYGLLLAPASNNNNYSSFYSSTQGGGYGPWLQITYTPQANDGVLKLKWPLGTTYTSRVVTQPFNVNWAGGSECPPGVIKKHNGTDYRASAGTAVYATEDGWVKHVEAHSPWAYHIVIEHNYPSGKFTTVSWHVNPVSGITRGVFVPKGMQIATVANLDGNTHFHFGIRRSVYNTTVSGTGALPQQTCTDPNGVTYPGIPEYFINPEATNLVLFQ